MCESQMNYGKLWHDHDDDVDRMTLCLIKEETKVRWNIQHVTDRNHVGQMSKCLVERAFDREMVKRAPCTISRANDRATSLNCACRDSSSTASSWRSGERWEHFDSEVAVVGFVLMILCWWFFYDFIVFWLDQRIGNNIRGRGIPRKRRKKKKIKIYLISWLNWRISNFWWWWWCWRERERLSNSFMNFSFFI